jgi:hypothetical protein
MENCHTTVGLLGRCTPERPSTVQTRSAGLRLRDAKDLVVVMETRQSPVHETKIQKGKTASGAGGARTHDRRIMRSTASCTVGASCTDTAEPCRWWPRLHWLHRWLGPRTGPRPRHPIPYSCYCA